MSPSFLSVHGSRRGLRGGEQAGARTIVLLLAGCLAGIAISALLFYSASKRNSAAGGGQAGSPPGIVLSDSTKSVLGKLTSPLEIRFYTLLDPATVPESTTAFAGRAGQLLAAYQQQAVGRIKVTTFSGQANSDANAALADGVAAFNRDKGDACYLGVTLVLGGRKETLAHLSPQWEQALEPDLTRAIGRLVDAGLPAAAPAAVAQVNTNAIREVKALIPDVNAVSVQAGTELLQDAAVKEFAAAAKEMEARTKEAEQRVTQAKNGGSEAEQQAATKQLQQVKAEQIEKLKDIAERSQARIDTFQQLKAAPH